MFAFNADATASWMGVPGNDDGRSKQVRISAAGDDVLRHILPGYFEILNHGVAG